MRRTGSEPQPDADLASLTRELHPRLVGMLTLYTGDRHLAEDLSQEALIRLHQHWPSVRTHPSPAAWTSRVALNLAGSWWRRRGAERRANDRSTVRIEHHQVDQADVLAVRQAVSALPDGQRAVIVLRFYLRLSVRETADALGRPEGTVKSLTSSAVATLRRSLLDIDDLPSSAPEALETFHA